MELRPTAGPLPEYTARAMQREQDRIPIVVYGATGFTGRLISAELARRRVPFAVAGRDPAKLAALVGALGRPVETLVAALDAPSELERMAARARVVLDCAGPFVRHGRAVQDAALAARSHFLDITGEADYMLATQARDAEARAAGVALINAVGFDVVPTDAAAVLASEAAGAPVQELRIAFAMRGARPTQGTTRSALLGASYGGMAYVDRTYRNEPVGSRRWEAPFPEPIGPRMCVSIPWGDLATAPRSTGAASVRTYMAVPPRLLRWLPLAGPGARLLGLGPVRRLAEHWVGTLPEGPSEEERARCRFAVYAEARGREGTRAVWVTGGDGYDFTAASAAWCAEQAATPDFAGRGALTPSQAFGARRLLEALEPTGVRWGDAS